MRAVLLVLILHSFTFTSQWCGGGAAAAAAGGALQFCRRAMASETCAQPPTVDDIQLEAYLGKWYEIGSSASFKLLTESGLACDQALYRATPDGHLTLLNSGLQVISPLAVAEVGAINVAANGVCAGARAACSQLAALRQVSGSLLTNASLGVELANLADAAELCLQKISQDVSSIQQVNGKISQADYSAAAASSSLQSSIAELNSYVNDASKQQAYVGEIVTKLNQIRTQIWEMSLRTSNKQSKQAFENASLSLSAIALKLTASSTAAEVALKAVSGGATALVKNGQPIGNSHVFAVTGNITQPSASSAGKLQVRINGESAPYWIVAVEKGASGASYSAALVYSCSEVAGTTSKSLFVLSREPELDTAKLAMFLSKAESYGIYSECDDPFLLSVQRGGDCGKPM